MELIINILLVLLGIVGFVAAVIITGVIVGAMILVLRMLAEELSGRF